MARNGRMVRKPLSSTRRRNTRIGIEAPLAWQQKEAINPLFRRPGSRRISP